MHDAFSAVAEHLVNSYTEWRIIPTTKIWFSMLVGNFILVYFHIPVIFLIIPLRVVNIVLEILMLINFLTTCTSIGGGRGQWLGGTMASAEHQPITGVWGQSPSGVWPSPENFSNLS